VLRVSTISDRSATLDQVIAELDSASDDRAALTALIRFVAPRWVAGVLLAVDGRVLRPSLAFGGVAVPDALAGLELARDGVGPVAVAARAPTVICQAAADPLLAQLLCGRRRPAAIAMSVPRGFEVSHVLFACDPVDGSIDRAGYALLLHHLGTTRQRAARSGQWPNRKPSANENSTDPVARPSTGVGEYSSDSSGITVKLGLTPHA
jgi:hypothetical protein